MVAENFVLGTHLEHALRVYDTATLLKLRSLRSENHKAGGDLVTLLVQLSGLYTIPKLRTQTSPTDDSPAIA